jgi:DNA-binding PucR family transcriptional regulator
VDDRSTVRELTSALTDLIAEDSELGRELMDRVLAEMPELRRDEEVRALALAAVKGTLEAFAVALEHDVPEDQIEAPWLTLKYTRRVAWDGVSLDVIIRGYRFGLELLFDRLTAFAEEHAAGTRELASFVARSGKLAFRFADVVCTQLAAEYAAERESIVRGALARRAGVVRGLLAGDRVDVAEAERVLGYRFDGLHLGVLLWGDARLPGREASGSAHALDKVAAAISAVLDCARPLLLHEGPELLAGWIRVPTSPVPWDGIEAALEPDDVLVAAGTPLSGLQGFRETRRQAERARAVALARSASRRLIRYDEAAVVSLLVSDLDSARAFVAEQLGPLAADDDVSATLRRTLLVLFRSEGQFEAAEELSVHRNTIPKRIRRSEELLGRPLSARRHETETALVLCEWLGSRVLVGRPGT